MTIHRCTRCGHRHAIPHSRFCAMCWGYVCGEVPGAPADDDVVLDGVAGEVCDG